MNQIVLPVASQVEQLRRAAEKERIQKMRNAEKVAAESSAKAFDVRGFVSGHDPLQMYQRLPPDRARQAMQSQADKDSDLWDRA